MREHGGEPGQDAQSGIRFHQRLRREPSRCVLSVGRHCRRVHAVVEAAEKAQQGLGLDKKSFRESEADGLGDRAASRMQILLRFCKAEVALVTDFDSTASGRRTQEKGRIRIRSRRRKRSRYLALA